jgi:hypothetical protein
LRKSDSKLVSELERLKRLTGLGPDLNVIWRPLAGGTLSGEVKDNKVYVYEAEEKKAVETLYHEFLDYCISRAIEPYRKITNKLVSLLNDNAYSTKEETVEGLAKIFCNTRDEDNSHRSCSEQS